MRYLRASLLVIGMVAVQSAEPAIAQPQPETSSEITVLPVGGGDGEVAYTPPTDDSLPDGPTSVAFDPSGRLLLLDDQRRRLLAADPKAGLSLVADLSAIPFPIRVETVGDTLVIASGDRTLRRLVPSAGSDILQIGPDFDIGVNTKSPPGTEAPHKATDPFGSNAYIEPDGSSAFVLVTRNASPSFPQTTFDKITLVSKDRIVAANVEAIDPKNGTFAVFVQRHKDIPGAVESRQFVEFYGTDGPYQAMGNVVTRLVNVTELPTDTFGVYDSARVAVRFDGTSVNIATLTITSEGAVALVRSKPSLSAPAAPAAKAAVSYKQKPEELSAACQLARALRPSGSTDTTNQRLVTASEAVQAAKAYANAEWLVESTNNLQNTCAIPHDGKKSGTVGNCRKQKPQDRIPGSWRLPHYKETMAQGTKVTGVPYCWGCDDTIETFKARLRGEAVWGHFMAGDICTRCGGSCNSISAGVDCSGLVGRVFKIVPNPTSVNYSTAPTRPTTSPDNAKNSLFRKAVQVDRKHLQQGDLLLRPGHVGIVRSVATDGVVAMVESATGNCRKANRHEGACEREWDQAMAEQYTPMRPVFLSGFALDTYCPK